MFINYIKTALRSLRRHKFFSAINVIGLAVAMSIGMGIIMLVADQMEYDRHNTRRDRIYRITTNRVNSDGSEEVGRGNATSSMPLRDELLKNYTGVEKVVRLKRGFGNHWLEFEGQDVNIPLAGFFADPEVFELFEYEFQFGDPSTALRDPYSVVLTRKAADKLFLEENPIGLAVTVGDLGTYTVTGVLKESTKKSHIVFEALASMATVNSLEAADQNGGNGMDNWTNFWEGWTYILVEPGRTSGDIQQYLDKIYEDHVAVVTNPGITRMKFHLQSIGDITPGPMMNNSIGPVFPWIFVYFLGGLSIIILLTSCFNFTNLSIARSLSRAREIGVRKVTGAARWQIFIQFLSESIIVALVALVLALGMLFILKPLILQLNLARIFHWDLEGNIWVYGVFLLFAIMTGVLAGFFPAIVLSALQPVKVLKSLNNLKVFSRVGLRKVLLATQFTLSLFFILSVIVMHNQLKVFMTQDHGFAIENNMMIRLNNTDPTLLKTELMKYSNVESVSAASHVPAAGISHGGSYKRTLDEPEWTSLGSFSVDEDYLNNMAVDLVAGNFFHIEQRTSKQNHVVINEAAVTVLGFSSDQEAVGEELISEYDSSRWTIIGVVRNYNHRDLTSAISPMVLTCNPERFSVLQVRYSGDYANAARTMEKAWATVNPGLKIDYKEVASEIRQFYEIVFGDLVKVLGAVAFLAIVISCMGLLGMVTYTTESRIKEISIRKILGSGGGQLVMLLSKGFIIVIVVAIAVGIPLAWFVNNLWLELIAYRTSINAPVILQGVLILLLFGALTVGSQTIRAIFVNPADNLKNE